MKDFVEKIEKGLEASKRGFAYLHIFSPCPTGWGYPPNLGIEVARKAVKSNFFPLIEFENGKLKINVENKNPIGVGEFLKLSNKFKHLRDEDIAFIQEEVNSRMELIKKLAL